MIYPDSLTGADSRNSSPAPMVKPKPLENPRYELFAQMVVQGKTDVAAYEIAFASTAESAKTNAWRIKELSAVRERISGLLEQSAAATILSLGETHAFLRAVVKTPIGKIDEASELAQSVKRSVRTNRSGESVTECEIKVPDKLRALELNAKLAGYLNEPESCGVININLICQELPTVAGAGQSQGVRL